ncbi:MAG: cobalamin biosynthesis protein [Proteocatella sp.]
MKIYTIAFTSQGAKLQETLRKKLEAVTDKDIKTHLTSRLMERLRKEAVANQDETKKGHGDVQIHEAGLKEFTQQAFENADQIIYIGAAGIAVRAIAPFIISKEIDPGVMVIDELGSFVIPILSGHIGGSNAVAQMLAEMLGSTPVITTATDINNRFAVDTWAVNHNMTVANIENIKHISAAVLENRIIGIYTDSKSGIIKKQIQDIQHLYSNFVKLDSLDFWSAKHENQDEKDSIKAELKGKFEAKLPENIVVISSHLYSGLGAGSLNSEADEAADTALKTPYGSAGDVKIASPNILHLIPKNIFAGMGCRKNKDPKVVESLFKETLAEFKLDVRSVNSINTVDLKKDEEALLRLSDSYKLRLNIFTAEELSHAEAFTDYEFSESELVKKTTGVGNICERAAVVGAGNFINDLNKKKIRGKVSTVEASNEALTEDPHNQRMTGLEKIAMLKTKTKRDGVTIAIAQI